MIDVMHCVFLGIVAKSFMKYWFDPIHRLGAYSIKGKVSVAIYRKLGNFCCENIFVWVAGIRKLNARKFFSNEYLRHDYFSTATGCEKEQELLSSRLCKCLLTPGYHAVYCTSLHKKSEQSFFARVKVRRSTRRRLLSLVSIRRVVGIPVALQHLSNMLW